MSGAGKTLFERMSALSRGLAEPEPIDTSTLGPIRVDTNAAMVWDSPAECAADLRRIAADVDKNGMATISPAKLIALARIMDRWPERAVDACVSNF